MNSIKFKKTHINAVTPKKATAGSAGFDLSCVSISYEDPGCLVYNTGLAVEIPKGYVGLIYPRSSISKTNLMLSNAVGVLDSDFRGTISAKFKRLGNNGFDTDYVIGDRICQLVIVKVPEFVFTEVNELSFTERGTGGYGSTGR